MDLSSRPDKPPLDTSSKTDDHVAPGDADVSSCNGRIYSPLYYLLALCTLVIFLGPLVVDKKHYIDFVAQKVSDKIGMAVHMGDINFDSSEGPGVTLSNVIVYDRKKPILTIREVKANINMFKLITGSVVFENLTFSSPIAYLVRRHDGTFNLPVFETRGVSGSMNLSEPAVAALHMFKVVAVTNGRINWFDRKTGPKPMRTSITGFNLKIAKAGEESAVVYFKGMINDKSHPTKFEIRGKIAEGLYTPRRLASLMFTGHISVDKLDIARHWIYIDPYVPFEKCDGLLSMDIKVGGSLSGNFMSRGALTITNLKINYAKAFSSGLKPRDLVIEHDVTASNNYLRIISSSAKIGGLVVNASGQIARFNTINPKINLELDTNQIDVNELKQFIPDNVLTGQQTEFLANNIMQGKIGINYLKFDGAMDTFRRLDQPDAYKAFSGAIQLDDFHVSIEGLRHDLEDIDGVISLADNRLRFSGVKGRYGSSVISDISGTIESLHEWPTFDVSVIGALDLEEARKGLAMKLTSPELKKHIDRIESMSGSVKVDLAVTGESRNPKESLVAVGKLVFEDVGLESAELGLPVDRLNGEIDMDLHDVKIPELSWKVGSSSFKLSGKIINALQPDPEFDLRILSELYLEDIGEIGYPDLAIDGVYDYSGVAAMDMRVDGGFHDFNIDNHLDMTFTEFRFKNIIHKRYGQTNTYDLAGSFHGREKLTIDNLLIGVGESQIEMTGSVGGFFKGEAIDLAFSSHNTRLDDLDEILKSFDDIDSRGCFTGKFSIRKGTKDEPLLLAGKVKLVDADFKLPVFHAIFHEANADFELVNNQVFLRNGRGYFDDGAVTLFGKAMIDNVNSFNISAETDSLDLSDLFGPPADEELESDNFHVEEKEPEYDDGRRKFFDGYWDIFITSKKGTIGSMIHYQDLDTIIRYENKHFYVDPFTFAAHGGKWTWKADMRKLESGVSFTSKATIQDLDMEAYLKDTVQRDNIISGVANLKGEINGEGKGWKEIKQSLNGHIDAKAGDGVIHRFNLLSKIFTLLNVSQYFKLKLPDLSVEGMPFNSITARFDLHGGVAHSDDLLVDSEAMRIIAVGDYDIAENSVDIKVGVMPLITIDKIVSSIPVLGHVLTGDKKSLITSYYDVKGPLGDPKVEGVPFKSFASGIGGILKRLFELPARVIEKIKKNGESHRGAGSPENGQLPAKGGQGKDKQGNSGD